MSNTNLYPIKYAVLELKEKGGYHENYEDISKCFIVSKCFVISSTIKYASDGTSKIFHQVVFPYQNLTNYKISLYYNRESLGERVTPRYDAVGKPYPISIVSELFDTLEEASIKAEEENKNLLRHLILKNYLSIPISELNTHQKEVETSFAQELAIGKSFEHLIAINTTDLEITDITQPLALTKKKTKS